ncbi:MAG: competence protein ComE, partial [Leptolyngbya sp. SIO4C1]|nr:competence protein ComE [Leptolyngbya sp. SIO4C1]
MAGFLIIAGASLTQRSQSTLRPAADPLPQDSYVQVFFNQSAASVYTEPYRGTQRYGDNLEQVLLETIESATQSIDIAVQEFNLPHLAQALTAKARSGVEIRLILENQYSQPWSQTTPGSDTYARSKYENLLAFADQDGDGQLSAAEALAHDALLILQAARLPLLDDTADGSKGSGLMHHKFMVVDGRWVLTGSANWTVSGIHGDALVPESRGNANALLRIESPELARLYTDEFNLMWGDGPGGQPDSRFGSPKPLRPAQRIALPGSAVTVQFSPNRANTPFAQTVNGLIAATLAQTQHTADLALFVFSEQTIANAIATRHQAGAQVRA